MRLMSKLKMWREDWDMAEEEWNSQAKKAADAMPLKGLSSLPHMIGITAETAKNLKWKSLKWMVKEDRDRAVLYGVLKNPFKYAWGYLKSILKKKPYGREGDFFLYGIDSIEDFKKLLRKRDAIFVLGFSYCHKPFECPSGRFTAECIHDVNHPVCQQCFIGKAVNATSQTRVIPLFIPTVHYIGAKIFEFIEKYPGKQILFLITACEMTLEMFGDWGNMTEIKGLGVRLDGRICNTMKAFELSEKGIKPGLTVVLDETQKKIMELLRYYQKVEIDII